MLWSVSKDGKSVLAQGYIRTDIKQDGCGSIRHLVTESRGAGASSLTYQLTSISGRRLEVVERAVDGEFAEHDHLLDAEQGIAVGRFEQAGEVAEHDTGRGHGFAGVGQERFGVYVRGDDEHGAGCSLRRGLGFEVVIEGAFGGVVQFCRVEGGVGGCWIGFGYGICFRGIRRNFEH